MKLDFSRVTTEELDRMKQEAEAKLKRALLDAAPSDEIRRREKAVTQLAITIHNRWFPVHPRSCLYAGQDKAASRGF